MTEVRIQGRLLKHIIQPSGHAGQEARHNGWGGQQTVQTRVGSSVFLVDATLFRQASALASICNVTTDHDYTLWAIQVQARDKMWFWSHYTGFG